MQNDEFKTMLADREAENLEVVRQFFADWSKRDAELLAGYLADDFVYQMVEGQPDICGPQGFIEELGRVLGEFVSVEMKLLRHMAIGQLVMSERQDTLIGKDAAHSMSFSVASVTVVYDGKIAMLRDFPIRGGVYELGDAFQ
jgi:limonene-1,2-epoxide hydrolase